MADITGFSCNCGINRAENLFPSHDETFQKVTIKSRNEGSSMPAWEHCASGELYLPVPKSSLRSLGALLFLPALLVGVARIFFAMVRMVTLCTRDVSEFALGCLQIIWQSTWCCFQKKTDFSVGLSRMFSGLSLFSHIAQKMLDIVLAVLLTPILMIGFAMTVAKPLYGRRFVAKVEGLMNITHKHRNLLYLYNKIDPKHPINKEGNPLVLCSYGIWYLCDLLFSKDMSRNFHLAFCFQELDPKRWKRITTN